MPSDIVTNPKTEVCGEPNPATASLDGSDLLEAAFRFYDQVVVLQSDSCTFVDLFSELYGRFRIGSVAPQSVSARYTILTSTDNIWNSPVFLLDDAVHRLDDPDAQQGYIYGAILQDIVGRVRSHFLIHAGVVSSEGRGVLLVADSFHGKTTLTLELVRRGFFFLSDEMAALGRADGLVHPFPRRLRIRPGTLELTGMAPSTQDASIWLDKLILDIEEIRPRALGAPIPVNHVIILKDPRDSSASPASTQNELGVQVVHLDASLVAAVRALDGVAELRLDLSRAYPLLWIRAAERGSVLSQIEALCRAQNVWILDIIRRVETRPLFTSPAHLEAISKRGAVLELLSHFQGGHKSALLQTEFDNHPGRLFMALAATVSYATFHHLFVGPLDQMADAVCDLVGAGGSRSPA